MTEVFVPRTSVVYAYIRISAQCLTGFSSDYVMSHSEVYHESAAFEHIAVLFKSAPDKQSCDSVLTVCMVVSELRIAELIAGKEHCGSAAAHEYGKGIFSQTLPE